MLSQLEIRTRALMLAALALAPLAALFVYAAFQAAPDAPPTPRALAIAIAAGLLLAWWSGGKVFASPVTPDAFGAAVDNRALEPGNTADPDDHTFFLKAQQDVLGLMAHGAPLSESLMAILQTIEKSSPASLCSILLKEGTSLRVGAAPTLPQAFSAAIDGLQVAEGSGACGTAAFRGKAVLVADVRTDPLMVPYRELLAGHGLRACWSAPVLSINGEVLATFAIYRREPGLPDLADQSRIAFAIQLATIALEKSKADAALVSSEARFRDLAEKIEEVFYVRDGPSGAIQYISPAYEKIWGRSVESLHADAASYLAAVHADDLAVLDAADAENRAGKASDVQYRISLPDGSVRWIRDSSYPVLDAAGQLERVVGTAHDVTERTLANLELASTNRAAHMLSQSSMALSRTDSEESLLAEVCRIAVDVGNYRMAWVGYARDDDERTIEPVARAGQETAYLDVIKLSWSDAQPMGQGPAGQVIRSGEPRQSVDIALGDNRFCWQEEAVSRGFNSALFLPLRSSESDGVFDAANDDDDAPHASTNRGPHTFGVLCLYAGEAQQFSPQEVSLLQELADNFAFGIGSQRARLERRRIREAARLAAAKVREQASLLDRAQDAIMVRDLDMRIRYWSKGAERLYGWTAEEALGRTLQDEMYASPEVLQNAMAHALQSGGDWASELEQRSRNGAVIHVAARWTLVRDDQGLVNGVLGINTDIRERKRWREAILRLNASLEDRVQQRTAQLEFANEQLEAFSYSVSHDLRTPLSSVDGFTALLEKSLQQEGDEPLATRRRHYLARIRAGVLHMGDMIDALLALADVSRSRLQVEPVDLSAQAAALLELYRERDPARQVQLDVQSGMVAQGDRRLLNLVLDNLLGNAWKFSGSKPLAHISFSSEILPAADGSREKVYAVRDNGAGFDMAYADKLFGVFQRLHSPTEFAGTGIGLTTVQRIIARHGGRVWGESTPGDGATFYFTLGSIKL